MNARESANDETQKKRERKKERGLYYSVHD